VDAQTPIRQPGSLPGNPDALGGTDALGAVSPEESLFDFDFEFDVETQRR